MNNLDCNYVLGPRQLPKAVAELNQRPDLFDQSTPFETAPAERRDPNPPPRRLQPILPFPEALGAVSGGQTAGQLQDPEELNGAFRGSHARRNEILRFSQARNQVVQGFNFGPKEIFQFSQEHDPTYRVLDTTRNEFLHHPREPNFNFGGWSNCATGLLQYPQQADLAFGVYLPQLNEPRRYLGEPEMELGESFAVSNGTLPYTAEREMSCTDPNSWPEYSLSHQFEPRICYTFNNWRQPSLENGQTPAEWSHINDDASNRAQLIELDAMGLLGKQII